MAKRKSAKTNRSAKSAKSKKRAVSKSSTPPPKPNKTIGILHSGSAGSTNNKSIEAFLDKLAANGYKMKQNLALDPATTLWSNDDPGLLAKNADKLAGNSGLDLIIAAGGPPSVFAILDAQRRAKTDTDVVFTSFSQLTSPALNMTGVDARTSELDPYRLAKLYNLVHPQWPDQTTFGVLQNNARKDYHPAALESMADHLNIKLDRVNVTPGDGDQTALKTLITRAFQRWNEAGIKVALVAADPLFNNLRRDVIQAEKTYGIAAMHQWHEFKNDGGYASYGTDLKQAYQTAGTMAAEILDGTDVTEIPVRPLTNIVGLSVNRAAAKRLGLRAN
jgi:putative ABC transport system substrate-binding protein